MGQLSKASVKESLKTEGKPTPEGMRYCHHDCPAGVDRRHRLYVKFDSGTCYAYCHNCGDGGVFSLTNKGEDVVAFGRIPSEDDRRAVPKAGLLDAGSRAYGWLINYLSPQHIEEAYRKGMLFAENDLVTYKNCGDCGQSRYVDNKVVRTFGDTSNGLWSEGSAPRSPYPDGEFTGAVVVVEDFISALKVARTNSKIEVVALLGGHMTDEVFDAVRRFKDGVILWMDTDAGGVWADAKIRKRLDLYGINNYSIRADALDLSMLPGAAGKSPKNNRYTDCACVINEALVRLKMKGRTK